MCKTLIIDTSDWNLMSSLLSKAGYEVIQARGLKSGVDKALALPAGSVIVAANNVSGGGVKELDSHLTKAGHGIPIVTIVDNLNDGKAMSELVRCKNIVEVIQRGTLDKSLLEAVNRHARKELDLPGHHNMLPDVSKTWQKIEQKINAIAPTDTNVIVFGGCGSGKEQIAKQIYLRSSRANKPVKVLEAGGASLVEHVEPNEKRKDIYTRIKSYFLEMAGGTLIVKNVEFLSMDKQSVLLHLLKEEKHDVRLICTADPKLLVMVDDGTFRDNLFFTLRGANIMAPALRDITEEIKVIAEYFLTEDAELRHEEPKHLSEAAIKELKKLEWPGNLRELRNMILLAAHTCKGKTINKEDLELELYEPRSSESERLHCPMEEKRKIERALKKYGNKSQAAKALKISRNKLDDRIKKYGIDVTGIKDGDNSTDSSKDAENPENGPVDNLS